jgi:hypothetical protein
MRGDRGCCRARVVSRAGAAAAGVIAVAQVIFGIELTHIATDSTKVVLNPGQMIMPSSEKFIVFCFVIAKDEVCQRWSSASHACL